MTVSALASTAAELAHRIYALESLPVPLAQRRAVIGGISGAQSFDELGSLAVLIGRRLGMRLAIVCGPISSGTALTLAQALERFDRGIAHAADRCHTLNLALFDQFPLEEAISQLRSEWLAAGNLGYCWPILFEVYQPLFQTMLFDRAFVLPGWEHSTGASWEVYALQRLGVKIDFLSESDLSTGVT